VDLISKGSDAINSRILKDILLSTPLVDWHSSDPETKSQDIYVFSKSEFIDILDDTLGYTLRIDNEGRVAAIVKPWNPIQRETASALLDYVWDQVQVLSHSDISRKKFQNFLVLGYSRFLSTNFVQRMGLLLARGAADPNILETSFHLVLTTSEWTILSQILWTFPKEILAKNLDRLYSIAAEVNSWTLFDTLQSITKDHYFQGPVKISALESFLNTLIDNNEIEGARRVIKDHELDILSLFRGLERALQAEHGSIANDIMALIKGANRLDDMIEYWATHDQGNYMALKWSLRNQHIPIDSRNTRLIKDEALFELLFDSINQTELFNYLLDLSQFKRRFAFMENLKRFLEDKDQNKAAAVLRRFNIIIRPPLPRELTMNELRRLFLTVPKVL
jgi:hypothetical protein